jgi:hypothetical protein
MIPAARVVLARKMQLRGSARARASGTGAPELIDNPQIAA